MSKERLVTLREYVQEALKNAVYEVDAEVDAIAAWVSDLPGCFAQARDFEAARKDLIYVIALLVM